MIGFKNWLARRNARLARIRIFYEPDCGFCLKTAMAFRKLCLVPGVSILPSDSNPEADRLLKENNSWVVYTAEGLPLLHWRAVAYVLKQNPLLWIIGAITDAPPLRPAMRKFYDFIGTHRPLWSKWLNHLSCGLKK
jgi:hypothetical protein